MAKYTSLSRRCSAASTSIADLSEHFNQNSLTPRRPNESRDGSTPRAREHNPSLQSRDIFSNRLCRRRQSKSRLQCSSIHPSRIWALVEDMAQIGLPTYDPTHSNPMLDDSTSPSLSPDEQPPSAASDFGFTPHTSSSTPTIGSHGYVSAQHSSRHSLSYKIDKDLRHSVSREGLGGTTRMVKKKIRLRKSSKSLSNSTGKSGV